MPSFAICKTCVPNRKISFKRGCPELFKHSESAIHVQSMKTAKPGKTESFFEDKIEAGIKSKLRDLEIAIVAFLSRHSVPPPEAECLMKIIKNYVPDSEIVQQASLGKEKARYLTIYGIRDAYEEETLKKMRNSDAFSVQIDESEVNKVSQLEIRANLSSKGKGIERRHFKVVDLEAGDAGTITETVLEAFIEDGIDVKGKLIDILYFFLFIAIFLCQ